MTPAGGPEPCNPATLQPCRQSCNRLHPEHVRLAPLHELLHTVNAHYCGGTIDETALEEREREGLANGLLQVRRNNPGFTDYLTDMGQ